MEQTLMETIMGIHGVSSNVSGVRLLTTDYTIITRDQRYLFVMCHLPYILLKLSTMKEIPHEYAFQLKMKSICIMSKYMFKISVKFATP